MLDHISSSISSGIDTLRAKVTGLVVILGILGIILIVLLFIAIGRLSRIIELLEKIIPLLG